MPLKLRLTLGEKRGDPLAAVLAPAGIGDGARFELHLRLEALGPSAMQQALGGSQSPRRAGRELLGERHCLRLQLSIGHYSSSNSEVGRLRRREHRIGE